MQKVAYLASKFFLGYVILQFSNLTEERGRTNYLVSIFGLSPNRDYQPRRRLRTYIYFGQLKFYRNRQSLEQSWLLCNDRQLLFEFQRPEAI